MSIKSNIVAGTAQHGHYALTVPRPSDAVSGALCQAYATPVEENDFSQLLARIDLAEQAARRS